MSGKTILIIDDSPMVCKLVSMTLEKLGFKVMTDTHPTSAQAKISSGKIDLVLLDINMPEIAGLDICKALKKDEKTKSLPVVFLSTIEESKLAEHAEECGADGYVNKNQGIHELSESINRVVNNLLK